jgi:glutamate dehydrogenase/leucine dehydrogenase
LVVNGLSETESGDLLVGLSGLEHEDIVIVRRPRSGLRSIIAVHSTLLGPSLGGARFYPYEDEAVALEDVLRLSRAMTEKAALAGLAQGGGKAVIIGDPTVVKTPELLREFAAAVNSLDGRYVTAEDVGTTQDDMDLIRETTPFVAGTATSRGGSGDPSAATALGVVFAMEAAAAHRWGDDLKGKTVCVVGAGKVGEEVIRLLVQRRAVVIAADVNRDKAKAAIRTGAIRLIDPTDAPRATADILCPCALGGLLTEDAVPDLHCAVIVGAANNQLASAQVADSLAAAGILYVPDFLANAGGIINIAEEAHGYDQARAVKAVGQIRDTATLVLEGAKARGITPLAAAEELVAKRLARARDSVGHSPSDTEHSPAAFATPVGPGSRKAGPEDRL